jgi:hypothetical protein
MNQAIASSTWLITLMGKGMVNNLMTSPFQLLASPNLEYSRVLIGYNAVNNGGLQGC